MKAFIISSLLISSSTFAQSLDLRTTKALMTQRQLLLEKINPGMSKKLITLVKYPTESGACEVTETALQTVLKIEGDKMIVHSQESYAPAQTEACAGFESQEAAVIYYEAKPSLAADLANLDEAAGDIKSISKSGDIITMLLGSGIDAVTVKYDLTKPSFKNLIFSQDATQTLTGSDLLDIDVNSIDLRNVFFCESAESENCSQGDWSDILF